MFSGLSRYIQSTCATSGEGLYEGLDWLSSNIANKVVVDTNLSFSNRNNKFCNSVCFSTIELSIHAVILYWRDFWLYVLVLMLDIWFSFLASSIAGIKLPGSHFVNWKFWMQGWILSSSLFSVLLKTDGCDAFLLPESFHWELHGYVVIEIGIIDTYSWAFYLDCLHTPSCNQNHFVLQLFICFIGIMHFILCVQMYCRLNGDIPSSQSSWYSSLVGQHQDQATAYTNLFERLWLLLVTLSCDHQPSLVNWSMFIWVGRCNRQPNYVCNPAW